MQPHRQQPTRLPRPRDSPGKNTGVGCHFLLQCMKVKSESELAQSCPTLSDPMDCSPPGSSVHGIFQTRILEWGQLSFYIIFSWDTHSTFNIKYASTTRVATRYLTLSLSEILYLSKCIFNTCLNLIHIFCSVSHLHPHGLQHARLLCPSSLLEFAQTHVHWVDDAIQPFHPLSPFLLLLTIFPSTRVYSNESTLYIRWPKIWMFIFSISPSSEYSGLIFLEFIFKI